MKQGEMEDLLHEILENVGSINIDNGDVDRFKETFHSIDATKVCGKSENISSLLETAITKVNARNGKVPFSGLLFAIKTSKDYGLPMEHIANINDVLDQVDNAVECIWGISGSPRLSGDNIEIIVVLGFDKKTV